MVDRWNNMIAWKPEFERDGFAVFENVVDQRKVDSLIQAINAFVNDQSRHTRELHAIRDLLVAVPETLELAESPAIRSLVESLLGRTASVVRGLFFDKIPSANWKVSWHQDLTIAVRERIAVPGFGPWSIKNGVPHVQPPVEVLEQMLTVRLHLDDCGADNGPLQVLPGSRRHGKLSAESRRDLRSNTIPVACTGNRGTILLMRPLLLHASPGSRFPSHRRVIHLEFAANELPAGLHWNVCRS